MLNYLLEQYLEEKEVYSFEGRRGLTALCQIARVLGYKDTQYFGQLNANCSIGDLVDFFEDNSGAIEAIIDWIGEQRVPEWKEAIKAQLNFCPECGQRYATHNDDGACPDDLAADAS